MAHTEYLSYDEYVRFGGTQDFSTFVKGEFHARKRIDYLTASRVQDMAEVPLAVKLCILDLIALDSAAGAEAQATPAVASYNTDGYSETYSGSKLTLEAAEQAMTDTIRKNLYGVTDDNGVPLLYRGVSGY